MRQAPRLIVSAFLLLFAASPGFGSTIAPPRDLGQLARLSRTVVLAESLGSRSELRGERPVTITTFRTVQTVTGEKVGTSFDVETRGGVVGEIGSLVVGTPAFEEGGRYLLFLNRAPGGNWRPRMSSYGLLREEPGTGLLKPLPEAAQLHILPRGGIEAIGVYRTADLVRHLAAVGSGAPWHRAAAEATAAERQKLALTATTDNSGIASAGAPLHAAPAACQFINVGAPLRWFGFEAGGSTSIWHTTPGQTGIADGGVSAVQQGAAAWTNHNASAINLLYAGSRPSSHDCSDGLADVLGEVTFNDPCNQLEDLGLCGGTLPPGWTSTTCCGDVAETVYDFNATATLPHDGEAWRQITGFSVVVNNGSQCLGETDFREMMTHYLGHGLGFNHHEDQNATMYVNIGVHPPRGAALGEKDRMCASYAYHSFIDVPFNFWAWRFIEAIKNWGVTSGCGGGNYCPGGVVTRGTMAVFLLIAKEGAGYSPPPCTTPTFSDLPCSNPFAAWVEELVRRGVTAGCGGDTYCPNNPVTRNQMAVFLIKTLEGPAYVPPACTQAFNDVPCPSPFAPWVNQMVNRGLTAGCGGGNFCPNTEVTRDQMAVFLSTNFSLPLP